MPNHHTRLVLLSLLAFAALAVAHTWPLAGAPAHWSRIDNGDAALNIWAVNWVGSHLPHDPAHLFEANIFYPERHTLAYSEMMLVQGLLAVPIVELGGSPVLAFISTSSRRSPARATSRSTVPDALDTDRRRFNAD